MGPTQILYPAEQPKRRGLPSGPLCHLEPWPDRTVVDCPEETGSWLPSGCRDSAPTDGLRRGPTELNHPFVPPYGTTLKAPRARGALASWKVVESGLSPVQVQAARGRLLPLPV